MSKLKIHPFFWLVLASGVFTGHFYEVLMVFSIVFVHEMGHVGAAVFFRWKIEQVELLPFGGVAKTDEHGNRPLFEETIVILAGPAQHLLLSGLAYFFYRTSFFDTGDFRTFMLYNLTLLFFNLLPVLPLDGGRLLRVVCYACFPYRTAIDHSLLISSALLTGLFIWSFYFYPTHLNLWVVLVFLAFSHYREWKQRRFIYMRFLLARYYDKTSRSLRLQPIVVGKDTRISDVLEKFRRGVTHQVIVRHCEARHVYEETDLLYAFFVEKKVVDPIGEL
ncbi:MAG TPA: site-2 protease family protein [Bacillales bacterium]|nr:site-2 protease family protein [Bacillales bacterium]